MGGTNPTPTSATLTGLFNPLTIEPGAVSISPDFSSTVSDAPTLVDQDLALIEATVGTGRTGPPPSVPEPATSALLGVGLAGLMMGGTKLAAARLKDTVKACGPAMLKSLFPVFCLMLISQSAFGQVLLTAWTAPSSGVAGVTNVNITGSGFPSGTIAPANVIVTIATSCGGSIVTTAHGTAVTTILGSTKKVNFAIPSAVTTGNYFLTIADSAAGDAAFTTKPGSCEEVSVTASAPILNACVAGSSMGVLLPKAGAKGNVTAYVPKGYWDGSTTGVFVENIEGTLGASSSVPTTNIVNSCSSNPATGQTVCVANNTDVYLITGTTLNATLNSGSNSFGSFSGGSCNNCGVAINANNNTAVINMGITPSPTNSGLQVLNLATNTFGTPLPLNFEVSENISVDPTRSLILSASESGNFTLAQIQANGSLKEFDSSFAIGSESDSSAEDCSTGVGLSPQEFTNNVALVNLNAITFGPTTYTAPNSVATLLTPGYFDFSAGLSGSAVAQGSGHLAVVTGEFGGGVFAVLKLPPSPGTAVPALVDYVVFTIPSSAACGAFSAGFDPHTITAYTSPNTGDAYAVFAGYSGSLPICLAVVDMTTLINLPASDRGTGSPYGTHEIPPTNPAAVAAVKFFAL